MFPNWRDWNIQYTRKGIWKQRLQKMFALFGFIVLLLEAFYARRIPSLVSRTTGFTRNAALRMLGALAATYKEYFG